MIRHLKLPSLPPFQQDAKLLIAASGIFGISFFGIQMLLKVLYMLRLGYGLDYIGLFNATGALAFMSMSMPSGALGSRFGTRRVMLVGGVTTVVGMAALPLVELLPPAARYSWPVLSQVFLTGGWSLFGVNVVPALMANTTARDRNSVFALSSTLRGTGTLAGTLGGGVLPGLFAALLGQSLDDPGPYRYALLTAAALALLGLIPLRKIERVDPAADSAREIARAPFPVWPVLLIALFVFLSNGGWAICQSFCNAYMDTDLHLSVAAIGLISGVGQLLAVFAPLAAPRLADLRGNGWTLMVSAGGIASTLLPLAWISHWTAAAAGRVGAVILASLWMPALQVTQMELVEGPRRALAYGIVSAAMGLSFATTSLAGGYIAEAWGYRALFLLGAALSLSGAALMWGMRHT